MIVTKPINLELLAEELAAASVAVGVLGLTEESSTANDLHTFDEDGAPAELPPAAVPIVDAHTAPPSVLQHVETRAVDAVATTTDATFHELWRLATRPKHVYRAALEMRATDAQDGTTKAQEARLVFKGLAASVAQVGTTAVLWSAQDAAASGWAIQSQVQGPDLVFGVRGAAGRTVGWSLEGQLVIFAPEGLA